MNKQSNNNKPVLHTNIFELPFLIYVAIVDTRQGLNEENAEEFIHAISRSNWTKSPILETLFKKSSNEFSHSWKKYVAGEFTSPLSSLQAIHDYILLELNEQEIEVYVNDVLHLVDSLVNSSDGLFLASTESKLKIHGLIKSILSETSVKEVTPEAAPAETKSPNTKKESTTEKTIKNLPKSSPELAQLWPLAEINEDNVEFWKRGKIELRCIQIIDETHDVKTFRFVANRQNQLFFFKPGQFIGIEIFIEGKKVNRSYTISSTPSRPHNLSITIKRVPGGQVSNWLHDKLKIGDIIDANGPSGKFNCFDYPAKKMLLISGGSGITPVMSMMRWLTDTSSEVDIVFLHNARTPHDIIFAKELDLLSAMHSHVKVVISVSQQESDGWQGFTGRISPQMIEIAAPDFIERNVYVCGPNEYMESTKDMLQWMKFPMENYYSESFGGKPKKRQSASSSYNKSQNQRSQYTPSKPVQHSAELKTESSVASNSHASAKSTSSTENIIIFKQSTAEVAHDSSDYILDIADDAGVDIPSSCLQGGCGTCKVLKIEGEVDMDAASDGLTDEEINEGYILACCSTPIGKVIIDA